jgi:uncharacterized LabA/DUF88 family protein
MRIGLDIATMSDRRSADRLVLVSGDTDMIPVMKHARRAGIEIVLVQLPNNEAPTRQFKSVFGRHPRCCVCLIILLQHAAASNP